MYSVIIIETETNRRPEIFKFDTLADIEVFCKHNAFRRVNDEVFKPQLDNVSFLHKHPKKGFVLDSQYNLVDLRDLNIMQYDGNI